MAVWMQTHKNVTSLDSIFQVQERHLLAAGMAAEEEPLGNLKQHSIDIEITVKSL